MKEKDKILIIDGSNLLYRAFWTAENISEYKTETTHICIFLTILKTYVELFSPERIIVCWDFKDDFHEDFRKKLDKNYKAQRDKEKSKEVFKHLNTIKDILDSLGITQINPIVLEADDIIFWLATKKFPNKSVIVSTDTDMYQLISSNYPGNIIYNPKKKREVTPLFLKEQFGVESGDDYIIFKAFRGDIADNLTGVKGIRLTKILMICSLLKVDFDLDALVKSKILKEEELEIFKHNLEMMKFSLDNISEIEEDWYEQCLGKEHSLKKDKFSTLIKNLEAWQIYNKLTYWLNTFDLHRQKNISSEDDFFSGLFDLI